MQNKKNGNAYNAPKNIHIGNAGGGSISRIATHGNEETRTGRARNADPGQN